MSARNISRRLCQWSPAFQLSSTAIDSVLCAENATVKGIFSSWFDLFWLVIAERKKKNQLKLVSLLFDCFCIWDITFLKVVKMNVGAYL